MRPRASAAGSVHADVSASWDCPRSPSRTSSRCCPVRRPAQARRAATGRSPRSCSSTARSTPPGGPASSGCTGASTRSSRPRTRSVEWPATYNPRTPGVFSDPGDRVDEPVLVVGDRHGGDRCSVRCEHLHSMGVAVGVAADHGVYHLGQHRHLYRISLGSRTDLCTTLMEVTEAAYLC